MFFDFQTLHAKRFLNVDLSLSETFSLEDWLFLGTFYLLRIHFYELRSKNSF